MIFDDLFVGVPVVLSLSNYFLFRFEMINTGMNLVLKHTVHN